VREGAGDVCGDVLVERAAVGDVHQLDPAADAEGRDEVVDGGSRERRLEVVAAPVDGAEVCVGSGAVEGGVDVVAADQQEAVDKRKRLAGAPRGGDGEAQGNP